MTKKDVKTEDELPKWFLELIGVILLSIFIWNIPELYK